MAHPFSHLVLLEVPFLERQSFLQKRKVTDVVSAPFPLNFIRLRVELIMWFCPRASLDNIKCCPWFCNPDGQGWQLWINWFLLSSSSLICKGSRSQWNFEWCGVSKPSWFHPVSFLSTPSPSEVRLGGTGCRSPGRLIGWKETDVSRTCTGREGWVRGPSFIRDALLG